MSLAQPPRSFRNLNPGNLRRGVEWAGLAADQTDPGFCQFRTAALGFRALAMDVHTKWKQDGLITVTGIITKYAPPSENDTASYIKAVCDGMGIIANEWLNLNDETQLTALCRAIATHEAGGWFWNPDDLKAGVDMALHPDVVMV